MFWKVKNLNSWNGVHSKYPFRLKDSHVFYWDIFPLTSCFSWRKSEKQLRYDDDVPSEVSGVRLGSAFFSETLDVSLCSRALTRHLSLHVVDDILFLCSVWSLWILLWKNGLFFFKWLCLISLVGWKWTDISVPPVRILDGSNQCYQSLHDDWVDYSFIISESYTKKIHVLFWQTKSDWTVCHLVDAAYLH